MFVGIKAGRALKRTTSSRISTQKFAATLPFTTAPLVQQDWHSLLDADSILAHLVPDVIDAAGSHQADDTTSEAPEPAGAWVPQPVPVTTPMQPASSAQPHPADPSTAHHSPPDQLVVADESVEVQPPTSPQPSVASPAQGASQPAWVQRSPLPSPTRPPLAEAQGTAPCMTPVHVEPAVGAKLMAPAINPVLPQAVPESSQVPLPATVLESTVSPTTEDVVESTGCLHFLCCFKRHGRTRKQA